MNMVNIDFYAESLYFQLYLALYEPLNDAK